MNSDSEEDFEATYEAGDEDEDGDVGVEAAAKNVVVHPTVSQPMNIPPFMRNLDLDAMNAPEFTEYANIGAADPEDGEFRIGMEYTSRKSIVVAIRNYTISRGVDYNVYESEPQTFYAKCKMYRCGCDWLIRASLIRKKSCWEIQRYNGDLQKILLEGIEGHPNTLYFHSKPALVSVHPSLFLYCTLSPKEKALVDMEQLKALKLNPKCWCQNKIFGGVCKDM
ncbi:hypothetical protein Ahy_A09g045280 [Arachis hypogaea]|uniref:Transposase MuDR plant domain-containing protein n=1 Tax=Arachis hypogaea TaxID=3818 RepID=A0A445BM01_ARAHY|nr:hypothetical protein Ahy_A09g045280 [Arachis hypogaea]